MLPVTNITMPIERLDELVGLAAKQSGICIIARCGPMPADADQTYDPGSSLYLIQYGSPLHKVIYVLDCLLRTAKKISLGESTVGRRGRAS